MRYNLKKIMTRAWELKRKYAIKMSDALKVAWAQCKMHAVSPYKKTRVRVHYGVAVDNESIMVKGTYDKETKTIEVEFKEYALLGAKLFQLYESIPQLKEKATEKMNSGLCFYIGNMWRNVVAHAA